MTNATQSALRGQARDQAPQARTAFGGITKSAVRHSTEPPDFTVIADSPEFVALRRRVKWFVFPMTALFLVWYLTYVVVAAYLPEFMSQPLFGEFNMGMLMGIGQFVSTVVIAVAYSRFAKHKIDPSIDEIQRDVGGTQR